MEIYLHIGTHKTGTTSTQKFLYHNRDILAAAGFLYPQVGIAENAHHVLGGRLIHDLGLNVFSNARRRGGEKNGNVKISGFKEWQQIRAIANAESHRAMIISTEELEWLTEPSVIADFLTGHDIKVIVYLRRQDSYLVSLYQTLVSDYPIRMRLSLDEWIRGLTDQSPIYNYEVLLDRWCNVFGQGSVRGYSFEDQRTMGLERSICRNVGIAQEIQDMMIVPEPDWNQKRRESLDWQCLETLRLANRTAMDLPKFKNLHRLMKETSDKLKKENRQSPFPESRDVLEQVMHSVEQSNERVRRKYLVNAV